MRLDYELQDDGYFGITMQIFDADDEKGELFVEAEIDIDVGPWERSFNRSPHREIHIGPITVREFGRSYQFDLYEVFGENSDQVENEVIEFYEGIEEEY